MKKNFLIVSEERERSLANNYSGGAITAQYLIESLYQKYEITSFLLLIDHKT